MSDSHPTPGDARRRTRRSPPASTKKSADGALLLPVDVTPDGGIRFLTPDPDTRRPSDPPAESLFMAVRPGEAERAAAFLRHQQREEAIAAGRAMQNFEMPTFREDPVSRAPSRSRAERPSKLLVGTRRMLAALRADDLPTHPEDLGAALNAGAIDGAHRDNTKKGAPWTASKRSLFAWRRRIRDERD
jgi:hypothetical protein